MIYRLVRYPSALVVLIVAVVAISVIALGQRTSQKTRLVAAKAFTVNAGATTVNVTIPRLRVGNAIGAVYMGSASKTTNTVPSGAYCATAGTAVVTWDSAVFTTATLGFHLLYVP